MTANSIYRVAGTYSGSGTSGDGGTATSALLEAPEGVAIDPAGDLFIADTSNGRVQEVAAATGPQWGQSMTTGDIYTVAGSESGTSGSSGDGGPAKGALLDLPESVASDFSGDVFIEDAGNDKIREVFAASRPMFTVTPTPTGLTVNQPDGSQVGFYPKVSSQCTTPFVAYPGSDYCTLPENIGVTLTQDPTSMAFSYQPAPQVTYSYSPTGTLTGIQDVAGDTLLVGTATPGSGQCPSSATSCQLITAASKRTLTIGFNANGFVSSVTDQMGRQWTYGYNGAHDMTTATDPLGNVTGFGHPSGTAANPLFGADIVTITNPNAQPGGPDAGKVSTNVYDDQNRVTSQTDPMGVVTTYNYCVNRTAGDCVNTATGTGTTTVTNGDGSTVVDSYSSGVLTAQAAWNGSTAHEIDYGVGLTGAGAAPGMLLDAWKSDAAGNKTSFTYDHSGNVASTTDPLSHTATMAWTSLGAASCAATATAASPCSATQTGPVPVGPGGVITPPSAAPRRGLTIRSMTPTDMRCMTR
jgi:YD repeat-containing protein